MRFKNLILWDLENMDEIALENFLQNSTIDKPMVVKKDGEEICKVLNDEGLLLSLVVPQMGNCNLEQQGESLEIMQNKAQKIAQNIKMDT